MSYKPFDLAGKVALITGGNGGIGLGFAEAVAAAGADVCIWGTNKVKSAAALEKLKAYGTRVAAFQCNVADDKQVEDRFQEVLKGFGRVDACFANAGVYGKAKSFLDISAEEWSRVIGVNLNGAFYTFRAAARHMVERAKNNDPGGRLIGTASLAAISGAARNEQYAASRGGADLDDKGIGRRVRTLRRHCQCHSAGVDRNRHDPSDLQLEEVRRRRHAAHTAQTLGSAGGFRRNRGLSYERRQHLPQRPEFLHRRRLPRLLSI
jgi:NAD(P)-dependent dehydrogenase (short-subunit alcohol dehydrogenase family)